MIPAFSCWPLSRQSNPASLLTRSGVRSMNFTDEIRIEQARYLHRNSYVYTLVNLLSVGLLALWFWDEAGRESLFIWVVGTAILSVHRIAVRRKFRALPFSDDIAQRWLRRMVTGPIVSSALWAFAAFYVFPDVQPGQQLAFLIGMVLYAVAAMFNYSVYYPSYLCVFLPFGFGVTFSIGLGMTAFHPALAGVLLLFILVITLVAWHFNRIFLHSLQLRFQNIELVQQLTVQKETAEAADMAKSRFLAAANHDLRQPMHAINLYLGTLAGLRLQPEALELLGKARQCGQVLDEMFRALLDMSRLDASAIQPEFGSFAIQSLLDRIRVQFEPAAHAKGLEFHVAPCSAIAYSDSAMVERILRNLVANAVRYTETGKILVGCRRLGAQLRIAVHDTGIGIPVEHQRTVFEEFYQLANPERDRNKGLGLGLAIVKRLARLLETPITLVSQPGRGSMFAIDVSYANHAHPMILPQDSSHAETGSVAGLLVTIVDDETLILDATRALLEQWGCTVICATSGAEALDRLALSTRAPDALICDYRLRGEENGIVVADAIRTEFNEEIPALLMTGDTELECIQEMRASGLPILYKPIVESTLKDALLQLARARPSLTEKVLP
jgi:two-component system, sensor histidine kinase